MRSSWRRAESPLVAGRSDTWQKFKVEQTHRPRRYGPQRRDEQLSSEHRAWP
jgi:hypothetical protein